jgi:isopentenyl-diphosphate delta-isomerase
VMDHCYKGMADIRQSLEINPQKFTAWFRIAFPRIEKWWQENRSSGNAN